MKGKAAKTTIEIADTLNDLATPAEALKQATHDNVELLALSGPRNPYPASSA